MSCAQALKFSKGGDSILPIHVLPGGGEHKASFITWSLTTMQAELPHTRGALDSPRLHSLPLKPSVCVSSGFMPNKHWAAKGI